MTTARFTVATAFAAGCILGVSLSSAPALGSFLLLIPSGLGYVVREFFALLKDGMPLLMGLASIVVFVALYRNHKFINEEPANNPAAGVSREAAYLHNLAGLYYEEDEDEAKSQAAATRAQENAIAQTAARG